MDPVDGRLTSSHWGLGVVKKKGDRLVSVESHPADPCGSPINQNIAGSLHGKARVLRPSVRKGWLENGPGNAGGARGREAFVEVDWDTALDLIATDLKRVRSSYGNESLFAGSYGWSSAGRFHHAQGQLKRFLNTVGGFVYSEGNYSYQAALALMPYIVGNYRDHVIQATRWTVVAKYSRQVVMFGGVAERNTQVSDGGMSLHRTAGNLIACAEAGVKFVNISPLRTDAMDDLNAEWLPPIPGSDTAIMLGIAHTLLTEQLHDQAFLDRYTVGFAQVAAYILGDQDNIPKTAEWAAEQSGLEASRIRKLARDMVQQRTMICVAAGVQRADYGEQPLWMAVTLASMLGQVGLPGGGYTIGYGVNGNIGNIERLFQWAALGQGKNPIDMFIPVAMISEMLLKPGEPYQYNGEHKTFPDIRTVWWAGGNPFHHHQDLNRLRNAFQQPETIIVNEINWTSTARHADIVLPVAAPQERLDFGAGKSDNALVPMPAHISPPADARSEYEIYSALAERFGTEQIFTEGRSQEQWIRELWRRTQITGSESGAALPDWDDFISGDIVQIPDPSPDQVFLAKFRADPVANSLPTISGRIELFSETIAGFGLDDCPAHATWFVPRDVASGEQTEHPLYLISGQPQTRLHSQLDNGAYSMSKKIGGREPILIHPTDAEERGIKNGDIVELYNKRGRCLAGACITPDISSGCVFLWTGAWYDPDDDAPDHRDRHGNPNVLTHDHRTSSLGQGPAAHSALVQMVRFTGDPPQVTVHDAPISEPSDNYTQQIAERSSPS